MKHWSVKEIINVHPIYIYMHVREFVPQEWDGLEWPWGNYKNTCTICGQDATKRQEADQGNLEWKLFLMIFRWQQIKMIWLHDLKEMAADVQSNGADLLAPCLCYIREWRCVALHDIVPRLIFKMVASSSYTMLVRFTTILFRFSSIRHLNVYKEELYVLTTNKTFLSKIT